MKKVLSIFIAVVFASSVVVAQQGYNLSSMYAQSIYNINPAYVGYDGCFIANLQHKKQWLATNGAPTNYMLQAHKGIGESSGLGLKLNMWSAGLLQNGTLDLSYAYHLDLNDKSKLSVGLNAGLLNQQFLSSNAVVFDNSDNTLSGANTSSFGLVLDAGVIYSMDKLKLGVSIPKFFGTSLQLNMATFDHEREMSAFANYELSLGDNLEFTPMVVYRQIPSSTPMIDLYGRLEINNLIGVGGGYRTNQSMLATLDISINDKYKFAYAFDYSNSSRTVAGASHEVFLGINICKKKSKYEVNIQQEDSTYQNNGFKDMLEVGEFVNSIRDTNKYLADRVQRVIDKNPGDEKFNVPLPPPIILQLHGQKYHFKTLEEMDQYMLSMKSKDPDLHTRLMDAQDDTTKLILRAGKQKFKFKTLQEMNNYILKMEAENPSLADEMKKAIDEDNVLIVNVKGQKFKFKNLKEMDEYLIKLAETNPALAAKIRGMVSDDPTKLRYDVHLVEKIEIGRDEEGNILRDEEGNIVWVQKQVPMEDIFAYTINIVDSNAVKYPNYFNDMEEIKEYEDAVRDTNKALAIRIQGEISNNPEANIFNVPLHQDIILRLHGQKYKFKTLKEMDQYILNLEKTDPDLAVRLKETLDENQKLIVNTKRKKYVFKTLREMRDFSVNLDQNNPELAGEFKQAIEDDNLLLVRVKGQKFKFRTLEAMEEYLLELETTNPALVAKIRALIAEDPSSLQYDVKLAKKIEMVVDPKTGEVSFVVKEVPLEEVIKPKAKLFDFSGHIVYFDLNSSKVDLKAMNTLNEVAKILKDNPKLKVEIAGYSCNLGSDRIKKSYSLKRASSVRNYLKLQGVKSKQMKLVGYGDKHPAKDNSSDENRKLNRRVEFYQIRQ